MPYVLLTLRLLLRQSLLRPDILLHARVHNLVLALDAARPTRDTTVGALGHHQLHLLLRLLLGGLVHQLGNGLRLVLFTEGLVIGQQSRLLAQLLQLLRGLELLTALGLHHLLDGACVDGPHLLLDSGRSGLGDRALNLAVLALVVEEPVGKTVHIAE